MTTQTNPNNPSLLDRVEGFFKGTTKKSSTPTLTSSLEHLHTSQHAQADAEAQHQAALMSGMPPGMPEGTQSLSSETLPQPMPRQVLNEVLSAGGQVPHATHVDIDKVEQQHEQAVGPLGQVQEPGLLDKAKSAIDSLTGKATTTSTQPIQHHPNIPHAALPDATLKQVQTAHGHPPHAHHVDVGTVEQRHEENLGLGHIQQGPSVLEKVTNKLQDLVPPTTFASTTTTQPTIQTHPNIPHAAVPDEVLEDVQSQKGKVPHATHVDIGKVEQQHDQAVGPLGTVLKEPTLLDKVASKIQGLVYPSATPTTTSTVTIQSHPHIPHSALSNPVLRDIQAQHGKVPHARHVDIKSIERKYEQSLGLGHVHGTPTVLLGKAKLAVDNITGKSVAPLTHKPIQHHPYIPHSALPDATLQQIYNAHGRPYRARHVNIAAVERAQEQRMIDAVGPLGRVLKSPNLLDKMSEKIQSLVQPSLTTTTAPTTTLTQDIESQKGKVPHAHHVNIDQVEKKHEQALGVPLGTVQEPSLLDKAKSMILGTTTTTQPIQHHPYIPHSALSDATLKQIQNAHGHPVQARHINIDAVERAHEQRMIQAVGPLGRVLKGPTALDRMSNKIQSLVQPSTTAPTTLLQDIESQKGKVPHAHHVDIKQVEKQHEQALGVPLGHVQKEPNVLEKMGARVQEMLYPTTTATTTTTSTSDIHPASIEPHTNIPRAAVPDQVLRDVESQRGKVPHAHHVDVGQVEARHDQAVGPLGHVQQEPGVLTKMGDKLHDMINRPTTTTIPLTSTTAPTTRQYSDLPATTSSDLPSTTSQHPYIPHAAVSDQVLHDVQSQKGKVPHARHVDIGPIEQRHEQAVGPLGHVQKEPTLMDKAKIAVGLGDTAAVSHPTANTGNYNTLPMDQHSNIPHAAVPDQVLKDVQHQKGKVPHAHHVDIGKVEQQHEQAVGPLGHVQKEPTLMDKAKNAVGLGDKSKDTTTPATTRTDDVPSHQRTNAGFIGGARAEPPVVLTEPVILPDTVNAGFRDTSATTSRPTTSTATNDISNIPHAAVPDQVLKDVQHQKGKVPHAHHVDVGQVEARHDQAVGPLGHVQKEPTLMDKAKHAVGLGDTTSTSTSRPTTTTTQADAHPNIPHAAVSDQVLHDVQHQKGKVPHAHHVDIGPIEQRHNDTVGPLGHVQKEPTLMDKAKNAVGLGDKSKDTTPSTTTTTAPSTTSTTAPAAAPIRTQDIPSQRTNTGFVGGNLAEPPVVLSDASVEPMGAPVAQRQPTLLDKMEYHIFGVDPVHVPATTTGPTTTGHTTTTAGAAAPTTTTGAQQDQHPNIPHAAVSDQVLKDVQKQKGKVPHAHHVDVAKVEQQHEEALGVPLGHVQKEPGLLDKAKHALGLSKDKDKDTTSKDISNKDKAPYPANEPRPNIMHNSLPSYVMSDIQDAHGQVPNAQHVDLNEIEMERSRKLALQDSIGHVMEDKAQPNIMHNSLPTRVMDELKDQHGHVPHANHVDINQVEHDRDANLSQHGLIGRVVDPSKRPNVMHSSLPTRVLSDIESSEDINQIEHDRGQRMSEAYMKGRITDPSLPGASTVSNPMERSNSGFTAGGFPSQQSSSTTLPSSQQSSTLPSTQQSSTLPSNTAYFKDTGASSSTTSNLPTSGASTINQPASSLTSDLGYKSGLIGSSTSTSKSTSGQTPLVATLPPGSNLESASGIQFKPVDISSTSSSATTGSTTGSTTTLGPHGPKFHEQK